MGLFPKLEWIYDKLDIDERFLKSVEFVSLACEWVFVRSNKWNGNEIDCFFMKNEIAWELAIVNSRFEISTLWVLFFFQIVRNVFKLSCQEAHQTLKLKELRKMTNIKFRMVMDKAYSSGCICIVLFLSHYGKSLRYSDTSNRIL